MLQLGHCSFRRSWGLILRVRACTTSARNVHRGPRSSTRFKPGIKANGLVCIIPLVVIVYKVITAVNRRPFMSAGHNRNGNMPSLLLLLRRRQLHLVRIKSTVWQDARQRNGRRTSTEPSPLDSEREILRKRAIAGRFDGVPLETNYLKEHHNKRTTPTLHFNFTLKYRVRQITFSF